MQNDFVYYNAPLRILTSQIAICGTVLPVLETMRNDVA